MSVPAAVEVPFLDLGAGYRELRAELDAAHSRVMESGHYMLGEELSLFEREFAAYCGAGHCVGVGNGLDALTLVLRALGIGEGDEVIVPAHTFIASWLAVSAAGAVPVPVDAARATRNLDVARVAAAIGPRTRAIMPVHLYGAPADMEALDVLASQHGLALIEDAAQAHGARLDGRRAGSLGAAAGFSFYPGKNLGCYGDGGAIVTGDRALAERARMLRNYGSATKYVHDEVGVNSRLDELQAAFLRVRLSALDEWNERRRDVAQAYLAGLSGIAGLELPAVPAGAESAWHLFVVACERRDELQQHLAAAGIGTLIHYPVPVHLSGAYAEAGFGPGDFPIAESLSDTVLSLPIGPHMAQGETDSVVAAVRQFFA